VRHEEMAGLMACGRAKFTGDVGVCIATSGPGAIHLRRVNLWERSPRETRRPAASWSVRPDRSLDQSCLRRIERSRPGTLVVMHGTRMASGSYM
jgi:hypothetical protein